MSYVGWTCGRCGGPVAGRFSACKECGFGGRPGDEDCAPAAGSPDLMSAETPTPQELAGFALRMVLDRIGFRIDAMNERGLEGVSISKGFAQEIVRACRRASELLENPKPAQAGLTAGGGSGSANVSEGVTGGGERAVGEAAGEIGGHLQPPPVGDPAAELRRRAGVPEGEAL